MPRSVVICYVAAEDKFRVGIYVLNEEGVFIPGERVGIIGSQFYLFECRAVLGRFECYQTVPRFVFAGSGAVFGEVGSRAESHDDVTRIGKERTHRNDEVAVAVVGATYLQHTVVTVECIQVVTVVKVSAACEGFTCVVVVVRRIERVGIGVGPSVFVVLVAPGFGYPCEIVFKNDIACLPFGFGCCLTELGGFDVLHADVGDGVGSEVSRYRQVSSGSSLRT